MLYQVAGLSAQAGLLDVAHSLADHGLKVSPDAKTKTMFEKLKATLPPAPPTPLDAQPAGKAAAPATKR
jgi:hypothetical protein